MPLINLVIVLLEQKYAFEHNYGMNEEPSPRNAKMNCISKVGRGAEGARG
jgi:hypothetical protein